MTLASDLAHLVGEAAVPVPGVVHDPLSPLVLGNSSSNLYCVQTYNQSSKVWTLQVTDATGPTPITSSMTMDANGLVKINGVDLGNLPSMIAQVSAAAASASAAAASAAAATAQATAAAGSAGQASGYAGNAQANKDDAQASANLAQQYANAPIGTVLPGGGNSAAVSAAQAAAVAVESRDLDLSDPVVADETYSPGFFGTERQVTAAGLVNVTLPLAAYTSTGKTSRWGSYKLASPTGSVKVLPGVSSSVKAASVVNSGRQARRVLANTTTSVFTLNSAFGAPAIVDGKLVVSIVSYHDLTSQVPVHNLTGDSGLVFTRVHPTGSGALPNPLGRSTPVWTWWTAPLTAFTAKTITLSITTSPNVHYTAFDWAAVEDWPAASGAPRTSVFSTATAANKFSTSLSAVAAQTLLIAVAHQNTIPADSQFTSFSTQIAKVRWSTSSGINDAAVPNDSLPKNSSSGFGLGVIPAIADVTLDANFSAVAGWGGISMIAIPPKTTSSTAVTLLCEGGRDTLTVPYGVMEIWAQPDGSTYHIRTPKP